MKTEWKQGENTAENADNTLKSGSQKSAMVFRSMKF
jgi:hypothetical protein